MASLLTPVEDSKEMIGRQEASAVEAATARYDSSPDRILTGPDLTFIFGSPRSGTTWLGKLIDAHPAIAYLHEPIYKGRGLLLHEAVLKVRRDENIDADFAARLRMDLARQHLRFSQPPIFKKSFYRVPYLSAAAWGWQRLAGWPALWAPWLMDDEQIQVALVKDALCPFSQALAHALSARTILLLRHPCAVVNSMLRGQKIGAMGFADRRRLWQHEHVFLSSLGYREEDLGALQNDEFEALSWLTTNQYILRWPADDRCKIVVYANLVRHTQAVIEEIFEWLGMAMTEQTESYARRSRQPGSDWLRRMLGKKKLYYSVTPRSQRPDIAWREEMSPDSIRRVMKICESFPVQEFWPDSAR